MKVLGAIKTAFDLNETGDVFLESISLTDLLAMYEEMVILSEKADERTYLLKAFLRTRLKPAYRLLFDVVHWVFFSQTDTNDQP